MDDSFLIENKLTEKTAGMCSQKMQLTAMIQLRTVDG